MYNNYRVREGADRCLIHRILKIYYILIFLFKFDTYNDSYVQLSKEV